jgi:radical SAM superfamily enzyme YgiQ (UPF0313 family)
MKNKKILLINPWIEDFSAYDLWVRPLNLLRLATVLRSIGVKVYLLDLLDKNLSPMVNLKSSKILESYGCSHLYREEIKKPEILSFIPRKYKRYGMPVEYFLKKVKEIEPSLIIVGSMMTYWYRGTFKVIEECKNLIPQTPIFLGGIYPIICPEHARKNSKADLVFIEPGFDKVKEAVSNFFSIDNKDFSSDYISPSYDLMNMKNVIPILSSEGCQFSCTYCASKKIYKKHMKYNPRSVFKDILTSYKKYCSKNYVFYDDALLSSKNENIEWLLEEVKKNSMKINFHLPNAIHAKFINNKIASLMKDVGFKTIRLGLEFTDPELMKVTGGKVNLSEYERAISTLFQVGFTKSEIGTYILVGHRNNSLEKVFQTCQYVSALGSRVKLAMYSPIPGTKEVSMLEEKERLQIQREPLFTNGSLLPYKYGKEFNKKFNDLKKSVEKLNLK